eukprot:TRINITY_DN25749_c0_g1_i2.p1 TRINITY_DN25749_c0_g1~~TRINITY_DN25749_c0_g1_i2.p1  ORF type:complete len:397 (+),score=79.99 TRINITY_DN25749_c0_g1_i2:72-1262(+)
MFCCPVAAHCEEHEKPFGRTISRHDVLAPGAWCDGTMPPLPEARESLASVCTSSHVYVLGGFAARPLRSVLRLPLPSDPASPVEGSLRDMADNTGTWESLPQMSQRREGAVAEVLRNKIYVCGGHNGAQHLCSVERLDLDGSAGAGAGAWASMPHMTHRRSGASGGVRSGCLVVCGGMDGARSLDAVESFNPGWGAWEAAPPMLFPRHAAASVVVRGVIYTFGGRTPPGKGEDLELFPSEDSAECFDPSVERWAPLPQMYERRAAAMAGVCGSYIYVVGGLNERGALLSGEVFDLRSRSWSRLPSMKGPRHSAGLAVVAGCVYVFGGSSGREAVASVEVFDPGKACAVDYEDEDFLHAQGPSLGLSMAVSDMASPQPPLPPDSARLMVDGKRGTGL